MFKTQNMTDEFSKVLINVEDIFNPREVQFVSLFRNTRFDQVLSNVTDCTTWPLSAMT